MKNRIMLTKAEKAETRKKLASFIKENPVRNTDDIRLGMWSALNNKIKKFTYKIYSLTIKPMSTMFKKPIALLVALLVIGGGGTVFASQDAKPGDALYQVKVRFNEPVREFLALNPEAKADFAINRVEKRLLEAEELTKKDGLTPELKEDLEDLLQDHIDDLKDYLEDVREDSGEEKLIGLNQKIENLLKNYEKKLERVEADTDDEDTKKEQVREMVKKVKEEKERNRDEEDEDEDDSDEDVVKNQSSAEGKMTAAQNKLNEVEKFLLALKDKVSAEIYADAEDKLGEAKEVFEDAKSNLTEEDYGDAFDAFKDAMEKAQDVKEELTPGSDKEDSDIEDEEDDDGEQNRVRNEERVRNEMNDEDEDEVEDEVEDEDESEDEDEVEDGDEDEVEDEDD